MTTHYTSVSVSGYNSGAPPDDGSTGTDNAVTWAKHKTKLGDPLKTAIEQVNTNLVSAFNNVPKMATGSYTGDGSTGLAVTGLGFAPRYLKITTRRTGDGAATDIIETWSTVLDNNVNGGSLEILTAGTTTFQTGKIKSFDSDGFTVGDSGADESPNSSGVVYDWVAWG